MNQESKLKSVLWNLDTIVASVVLAILIILTFAGVPFRELDCPGLEELTVNGRALGREIMKKREQAPEAVYLWDDRAGTVANGRNYQSEEGEEPLS